MHKKQLKTDYSIAEREACSVEEPEVQFSIR